MIVPYVLETIDPTTGKVVFHDLGVSMTLTDFTHSMGVPLRLGRSILAEMGLLQLEGGRLRLRPEHQATGLGMRLRKKEGKFPFDVLHPAGQDWAMERWSAAKAVVEAREATAAPVVREAAEALQSYREWRGRAAMTAQMDVCWLLDHFQEITTREIAAVLGVTEAAVFKWSALRSRQRAKARQSKAAELPRLTHGEIIMNKYHISS